MSEPHLSFVIPALNEETNIPAGLASIREHCPKTLEHEIIVVDNGSEDNTVEIAREGGAQVLLRPDAALGEMRNQGVGAARGRVIVFLDADVRLLPGWEQHIQAALERLEQRPRTITGAPCRPAEGAWLSTAWGDFSSRKGKHTHIGSGHMIVRRSAFLGAGGFDTQLRTGEDFEFCRRAMSLGFELDVDPSLETVHSRLPQTLREFVCREIWHGSGDAESVSHAFRSRVWWASVLFVCLHLVLMFMVAIRPDGWSLAALGCALGIASLAVAGAIQRAGIGGIAKFSARSLLVYVYLWARFVSVLYGLLMRKDKQGIGVRRHWQR